MKQVNNHWDSYGVFAIAQLILTKYDALDIAWEEAIKLYNEFYSSNYNNMHESELECIYKFMDEKQNKTLKH
jgi:hypothetical protein